MFHVELAPLGGIFGPLKSDLGVFWPFRGTDFIMGKNKNANFSKSPHGPIFKLCVVIREVILQKMASILDPVNFFSVLTLLADCEDSRTELKNNQSESGQGQMSLKRSALLRALFLETLFVT